MKKLYRKGTVHPSPPSTSDHLSFLPAAIFTLTVALSAEEKEVLAYLISFGNHHHHHHHHHHRKSSTGNGSIATSGGGGSGRRSADHPVSFSCYCFDCYMIYWVKWDSSPNRQLIHEIIDAFEDAPSSTAASGKKEKNKKARRKNNKKNPAGSSSPVKSQAVTSSDLGLPPPDTESPEVIKIPADGGEDAGGLVEDEEIGKGSSVRSFVGFVGEKIWGIWS